MWRELFLRILACKIRIRCFFKKAATGLIAIILLSFPVVAEETSSEPSQIENENRIYISADTLITNTNEKNAEFVGNVKATQGTTVITSERLKVFYREQKEGQQPVADTDVITRIIAEGNVKIVFDNQVATAGQADYLADKRIVILSGTDTKIISGSNSISGNKITLYRDDGRIQVEGSKEKRVEAFFYSQEGDLVSPMKNSE
jgi:lipopolysaccharide export system protein LptA